MKYPEFQTFIENYDRTCFVETKTDNLDTIELPGYTFSMTNRKQIASTRSGGIIVGYKNELESCVDILYTNCKYILWFKCSKELSKTDKPVIFGAVYIPPEYTKFASEDVFSDIEQEFLTFSNNSDCTCLLGDFNARTSDENDFIEFNERRHSDNNITE